MKKLSSILLFIFSFYMVNAQKGEFHKIIYLNDGSFLKGKIVEESEHSTKITLTDGTQLNLPNSSIWKIMEPKNGYKFRPDGTRILSSGWYNSISLHTLTAAKAGEFGDTKNRWSIGAQYSRGYYLNKKIGIGAGLGIDLHDETFLPVFIEATGYLSKDKYKQSKAYEYKTPFTYNLQAGYNIPIHNKTDFENITGSWMVYPSIGLLYPSKRGASCRIDVGYKFQRYKRIYTSSSWNDYISEDTVLLKSLAIRIGWVF